MKNPAADFFTRELAEQYDERNRRLAPIGDNLHFSIRLVLERLPERARILSVGAGTGADILSLAAAFPGWTFVAVEPSAAMLDVCRRRLESAGIAERCTFVHGFAEDVPPRADFDAVLAILVGHFVGREIRERFYRSLVDRLRDGGILVDAEISCDVDAPEFPALLDDWKSVQRLMGATPESLAALPHQLREVLTILAPREMEHVLREAGIERPVRFFQAFLISGWYGVKRAAA